MTIAKAVLRACTWGSVITASVCSYSQQAQSPEPTDQKPVFTLKVYTNLVQVPTLVLDHDRQPLRPIDFQRFELSLDGGKLFAPTHVRMEGDDPLDIAILLDVGGKEPNKLVPGVADAAAVMATKALHPQDRVSLYIVSCNLLRTVLRVQPFPGLLSDSITEGLKSPKLGKDSNGASCGTDVHLWGAIAAVVRDLNEATGRRAVLVVSDGHDGGSTITWQQLHDYAGLEGTALFGLRSGGDLSPIWRTVSVDEFHALCESTGGIVMYGDKRDLQKRLLQWVQLLRGRYVVEFPRPQSLGGGAHGITVSIKKDGLAFTTVAGVSVSLPDQSLTADPNYVPSNEGSDIPVGKQRPQLH
jgi:hypothetical protein